MSKPVTPQDVFDMWQKMVNPGAYPLQALMFSMPDPKEIQKKIAELETVEHWLNANVSMLQLTIKSLQYQLAMVKGGEKAQQVLAGEELPKEGELPNPAAWAWKVMSEASRAGTTAMKPAGEAGSARRPGSRTASRRKKKKPV